MSDAHIKPSSPDSPATDARDNTIAAQRQAIEALNRTVNELQRHAQALEQQHQQMIASTSWRSTSWLRWLSGVLQFSVGAKMRRFAGNLPGALRTGVRRYGLRGFLVRIPQYLTDIPRYFHVLGADAPAAALAAPASTVLVSQVRPERLHPELRKVGATLNAKVSVVIPTLNAGAEFPYLLRKLKAQKGVREIEIVVIDSGSKDATVSIAMAQSCRVIQISPADFSHSGTRNQGADAGTGDYILFMVQDAYPIGDYWLYGMLDYLQDHAESKLAAVSCSEFSRSDSDMMYDSMINTHYKFLGCLEHDRIGSLQGTDHVALRSQGQLSDVSCLISRELFSQYRYRGDYAEDLDLGIRLIRDGYRVAMLASVKVIHSHNRPAYYYLKRSFVDVVFLADLFGDFSVPPCRSLSGLAAGVVSLAAYLSQWLEQLEAAAQPRSLPDEVTAWIRRASGQLGTLNLSDTVTLKDERLEKFVDRSLRSHLSDGTHLLDRAALQEARHFADSFIARLDHFNQFSSGVYQAQDALLRSELQAVICKTFAATVGAALAFFYLDKERVDETETLWINDIFNELKAGV